MFVNTYIIRTYFFACLLVSCMCCRLLYRISDDATWISEFEMIHFTLSMYLSSWWWVYGCMDEVERNTTGVKACGV